MQSSSVAGRGEGTLSEVGFYHLTRSGALEALPKLLGRTLEAGQRALIRCQDPAAVSEALWASAEPAWLPNGMDGDAQPALHPIWISADAAAAPNGARYLFLLDGAPRLPGFDRIFDLFDGNKASSVQAARTRWTTAKAEGHALVYWQQTERGWVKKA